MPTRPVDPGSGARLQTLNIRPVLGLNSLGHPADLQAGEAAVIENFEVVDQMLVPRPGFAEKLPSRLVNGLFCSTQTITPFTSDIEFVHMYRGLAGAVGTGQNGVSDKLLASSGTQLFSFELNRLNDASLGCVGWSSSTGPAFTPPSTSPTATGINIRDFTTAYVPEVEGDIVFITGNLDNVMIHNPAASSNSHSEFTNFQDSGFSSALYCTEFDDRVVYQGLVRGTTQFPTAVAWSQRGNPYSMSVDNNAGTDLLPAMNGNGRGIFSLENRLILFSTDEVWKGIPRRDSFGFDFVIISKDVGVIHRKAVAKTPIGLFWLDYNYQMYLLSGDTISRVGGRIKEWIKEVQPDKDNVFLAFDPRSNTLNMFVGGINDNGATRYASLSLESLQQTGVNVADGIWTTHKLEGGLEATNAWGARVTQAVESEDFSNDNNPERLWISSDKSVYHHSSDATMDAGSSAFTARYLSHAFPLRRSNAQANEMINEVWVNSYDRNGSDAQVDVYQSNDLGNSLITIGSIALSNTTQSNFVPANTPSDRFVQIELQVVDGSRPRISSFDVTLRGRSGTKRG